MVVEPGENPLTLETGKYSIAVRPGACLLEVWGEAGNLVRRVIRVERTAAGLDLWALRFGGEELRLQVYDRATKASAVGRRAERTAFAHQLRRILERRFPLWRISPITSAADLGRSLSPRYARGRLTRGDASWAVIGASEDLTASAVNGILAYGLIWLDQVRRAERRKACAGLRIIVPRGREATTAARLPWLRQEELRVELWTYDRRGELLVVEPETAGNLTVELPTCYAAAVPEGETAARLAELLARVDVETVALPEGVLSVRVRGIEFAQIGRAVMTFGLAGRRTATAANFGEALRLADHLARFRRPDLERAANPFYSRDPERWLESQVRRNPAAIDPSLESDPIYAHVPAVAGGERGVMDLLARDRSGRLVVLELKADEDIQAPLQALDYWMRVRLAHQRGDFLRQGYFAGLPVAEAAPRLMLVAPALKFHPMTETILRYLRPAARVERVGVGAQWRRELHATFRLEGAGRAD